MNNPDLKKLHEQLKNFLAEFISDESFDPKEFIPTACLMSPDGATTLCAFPMQDCSETAMVEMLKGMRRMLHKEASEGKLSAYGFVLFPPDDPSAGEDEGEGALFILEHECGDGGMIEQPFNRNAAGKIELGDETIKPLPDGQHLWTAEAPADKPEPAEDTSTNAEPMTEERVRDFIEKHIPVAAESYCRMIESVSSLKLDYSAESISKLDPVISEVWPDGPALPDQMTMTLGSYLGESMRRNLGGQWAHNDKLGFHVVIGTLKACPFNKARKRLLEGEADSVGAFYKYICGEVEKASPTSAPAEILSPTKTKKTGYMWALLLIGFLLLAGIAYTGHRLFNSSGNDRNAAAALAKFTKPGDVKPLPNENSGPITNDLTILSAEFGMGKQVTNVTARVIELLQTQPGGFTADAKSLGADPLPGKKKHLVVNYDYKGESHTLTIPAAKEMSYQSLVKNASK